MNYRHAFHAGNFSDVVKHAVLSLLIAQLKAKPAPFAVFDLHAGIGSYDLAAEPAQKTLEYRHGIERFLAEPPPAELAAYADAVARLNGGGDLRFYPGSPRLARMLMREDDRLVLVELHPEDARALRREFRHDARVAVHQRDAYEALKGLLPPPERRGLVLIDPPFEVAGEYDRVLRGLDKALRLWPGGVYCVWYPIKDRPPVAAFHDGLKRLGRPCLAAELLVFPDDYAARLNGCGLAILNPPWRLDATLAGLMPELHRRMARQGGGARVEWLVPAA